MAALKRNLSVDDFCTVTGCLDPRGIMSGRAGLGEGGGVTSQRDGGGGGGAVGCGNLGSTVHEEGETMSWRGGASIFVTSKGGGRTLQSQQGTWNWKCMKLKSEK